MAKFNWDKINKENLDWRHRNQIFREKYEQAYSLKTINIVSGQDTHPPPRSAKSKKIYSRPPTEPLNSVETSVVFDMANKANNQILPDDIHRGLTAMAVEEIQEAWIDEIKQKVENSSDEDILIWLFNKLHLDVKYFRKAIDSEYTITGKTKEFIATPTTTTITLHLKFRYNYGMSLEEIKDQSNRLGAEKFESISKLCLGLGCAKQLPYLIK